MSSNDPPTETEQDTDDQLLPDGGVASSDGEDDPEPVPMTFYLKPSTHREVKRWLKRLELDHREIEDSQRHHQYEAIVQLAMAHEDEFIDKVADIK